MQASDNDIKDNKFAKPKPPSQDGAKRPNHAPNQAPKPSQDPIPAITDIDKSAEVLYSIHRDRAHAMTRSIEFQAYSDEIADAIKRTHDLSPSFFENLSANYTPIALNCVPSPLLIASGADAD